MHKLNNFGFNLIKKTRDKICVLTVPSLKSNVLQKGTAAYVIVYKYYIPERVIVRMFTLQK